MAEFRKDCSCEVDHFYPYTNECNEVIGMFCETCKIEWLLESLINKENQNTNVMKQRVICRGNQTPQTFYLKEKFSTFYNNLLPIRQEIDNDEDIARHLNVGDHISYRFMKSLQHHVIVENINADREVTIIHFERKAGIVRGTLDAKSQFIMKFVYDSPDGYQLVLARARMYIGKSDYRVLNNNCEHFAIFCKLGVHWSWQIQTGFNSAQPGPDRSDQTATGALVSSAVGGIGYEDMPIYRIEELHPGDHVIATRWALHPRCHMIVKAVRKDDAWLEVIQFTHQDGVVQDSMKLCPPFYKVLYKTGETFPADEVLQRASQNLGNKSLSYNILFNNCKSFARWCKTGKRPQRARGYPKEEMLGASATME